MNSRSLKFKLFLLLVASMAIPLAIALISLGKVHGSIQDLDQAMRQEAAAQASILRAAVAVKQQVQEWKNVLLRGKDPAVRDRHWKAFEERERAARVHVTEARAGNPDEQVRRSLDAFVAAHEAAGQRYREAFKASVEASFDPAVADAAVAGADRTLTEALLEAEKVAQKLRTGDMAESVTSATMTYRVAVTLTVIAMAVALAAMLFIVRVSILAPMGTAVVFARKVADGDLSGHVESSARDEAGELVRALAQMKDSLAGVVAQVRTSAESVAIAAGQVAVGTTDLSQRTEEQASSLEETAASMEELASTVKQNAENARQADELSRGAAERAERGGAEVVQAVVTMNEISESASRIADIISVIDAIAFQTNILALNAAVEAARAGEQGRGFAVVASEVRSLAQRSAQAAKEIKALIADSVHKAEKGMHTVEQAGDTIQALVIDVKRVSDLMRSIAEASAEQSRGVQQVNKTVTEMDKVVQQNASAVQQNATASEGMRRQAEALVQAVSAFHLGGRDAGPAAPAPARPAQAPASPSRIAAAPSRQAAPALPPTDDDEWQQF